jgi:hypothetical protein
MSLKDTRYCRMCPICDDKLIGTDDGLQVFESLKDQVAEGIEEPCCDLCGEDISLADAKELIERGPPALLKTKDYE